LEVTVGVEVPMTEGNDDGTGGQAVEGAGGEVGKHCRAEAKLMVEKVAPEEGRSGPSMQRRSADDEEDDPLSDGESGGARLERWMLEQVQRS
jgi:hypothetical protein